MEIKKKAFAFVVLKLIKIAKSKKNWLTQIAMLANLDRTIGKESVCLNGFHDGVGGVTCCRHVHGDTFVASGRYAN